MYFDPDPKKLWITLLKTRHHGLKPQENQGFCQIAHWISIGQKSIEINDLQFSLNRSKGGRVDRFEEVMEQFFVHKSRGEI